ncbi:hypothetical protein [Stenotrophomonas sp. AB1(2024)]|uniref:hypothetical protein n=1 Tax=Stenotrophomonas sp. AB1(2024) TaxID=3132215 RepID=UPI0030B54A82
MTLPSTGPITAQMLMQQYGGGSPFQISDYYRGGPRVPNTGANATVPTSGAISFANFRGQGGAGGGGLAASNSGATGTVTQNEPAPASQVVSASGSVFASGGSGSYTCTWSHLSGSTAIPTPGANVFSPSFTATVSKNDFLIAVKRCTVADGVNTPVVTDMSVALNYRTNL